MKGVFLCCGDGVRVSFQYNTDVVMFPVDKDPIIKDNIPCFWNKTLFLFMILYPVIPHCVFFPAAAACQAACSTSQGCRESENLLQCSNSKQTLRATIYPHPQCFIWESIEQLVQDWILYLEDSRKKAFWLFPL